ncbi:MAG: dTDP-glucose 4,6-dehydratase [unclassified Hahellaceae]|nr:dTDP-glucose 4,6-dehydratase [Hahellaceae bacterium]|tara:strand:+ start:42455 stop:44494 length:2040 start_codon:yes stop_codon:yes gene_type:complete
MSKATFDPKTYNLSSNEAFATVLQKHLSRRSLIKGGLGVAGMSLLSGFGLSGCSDDDKSSAARGTLGSSSETLGFQSIPGSRTDAVVVPEGYNARILAPWGTPLNSTAQAYRPDGSNTAVDQENAVGMHHDGMHFFPIEGSSTDGLLVINHEYIDEDALHPDGPTIDPVTELRTSAEEIRKEINAHGVSVVRVQLINGEWQVVANDPLNRRFTGATEMDIAGPLANSPLLQTRYSPAGDVTRGTSNNCGNGSTPWGTYLTCEENWPGYFMNSAASRPADQDRLGIPNDGTRYGWHHLAGDPSEVDQEFARFDNTPTGASALEDYRNEANGFGYTVEIDPYNPTAKAVKRTALGRFRQESRTFGPLVEGEPVVSYAGHDSRFEYIYKFVSDALWTAADANPVDRLATGSKYMDAGTLYVARFNEDGTGDWLPLTLDSVTTDGQTLGSLFATQADIILNTPGAADAVGATPMDRPEWVAVDPVNGTVYFTLTNNSDRETAAAVSPRVGNEFGHIVRWNEDGIDRFNWEIFVFGAPAIADADTNRSGLTTANQFASPDGLIFDGRGIMWIQTDNGAEAVTEQTNDQMLAVVPSRLRDSNNDQRVVDASNQDELRRFFVGPNGCEVTGLAFTPDHTTFFVNIQHPGNWPFSDNAAEAAPEGVTVRPRASTVVVRRNDGGPIGV